jgi:hypothetical protein
VSPEDRQCTPLTFDGNQQWQNLELVDVQFISDDMNEWLPWTLQKLRDDEEKTRAEATAKEKAKRDDAIAAKRAAAKEAADKKPREEKAIAELKLAKALLSTNKPAGKKRLNEIVDKYPDTKAAKEASGLLKE